MNFPKRLKDLREEKGYTQTFVAQNCDVSIQCISSLESGNRSPTGSTLVALAEFFDVSIDYLMGLEADTFKPESPINSQQQETTEFAMRIKELRKERNLTQVALAEALNVSNGCIAMLETNKSEPTANTLAKYADFFGCTTDYLLGREPTDESLSFLSPAPIGEQLTQEEKELVRMYRKIDGELRRRALGYMRKLFDVDGDEASIAQRRKS